MDINSLVGAAALNSFATELGKSVGPSQFGMMVLTAILFGGSNKAGSNWSPPAGIPEGFRPAVQPMTVSAPANGRTNLDLGDGYRMEINEHSSEIKIYDKEGNETQIWGDPHLNVNGKHVGDFWGTTTFELKNGTKITINTEPWQGNPNAYVASQVVITRGNQGIIIDGVSQNKIGDIKVTQGNGYAYDVMNDDGFRVREQNLGGKNYGWTSEFTGNRITQEDLNITLPGNEKQLATKQYNLDIGNAIMNWLVSGSIEAFASIVNSESGRKEIRKEVTKQIGEVFAPLLNLLPTNFLR
jgi:Domain of Unknown Function (DUF1521)